MIIDQVISLQALRNFIPAVITNRTAAKIEAAQDQAEAFWRCLLLDGFSPNDAMNQMRHYQKKDYVSLADARWMTPVLHCNYDRWASNPPKKISHHILDPFWHLKIDRVKQFGSVYSGVRSHNMRLLLRKMRGCLFRVMIWKPPSIQQSQSENHC